MGKGSGSCASRPAMTLVGSTPASTISTSVEVGSTCETVDPHWYGESMVGRAPIDDLGAAIRSCLTPELLKPEYRDNPMPYAGHCYVASESFYHLMGGKAAGWKPVSVRHEGGTHRYLEHADGYRVDLTAEQFHTPVPYPSLEGQNGSGFLTKLPSKRSRVVIDRLRERYPQLVRTVATDPEA